MAKNTHSNFSEDDFIRRVSLRIKHLRVAAGYTSYENFALDNNMDRKQYWRIENGSNITLKSLKKVLNLLKVSESDFFKDL